MYKYLIYQDTSLGSRFQELTYEYLERQQELANLDGQLHELIKENDNILDTEINVTETFNCLKSSLEDKKALTAKSDFSNESEDGLLKVYLLLLNLGIMTFKHIKNMNSNADNVSFVKDPSFSKANEIIEELQKGFFKKRNGDLSRKNTKVHEGFMVEFSENSQEGISIERFRKDVLPYMSLKDGDIVNCLREHISNKAQCKKMAKLLKTQPIISHFVDIKSIQNFLASNKSMLQNTDVYQILSGLLHLGHNSFQSQLINLFTALSYIFFQIRQNFQEIAKSSSRIPVLDTSKLLSRKLNRIPTLIKEKFKSKTTFIEQDIEINPIYKPIEMTKSQSKSDVKLTDEEAAMKRMRSIMPIQFGQENKINESEEGETYNSSKLKVKKNTIIFESFSPKGVLNEVKGIERKIKSIKFAERKAGDRNKNSLQEAPLLFKQYNKPWNTTSKISTNRPSSKETRPSTYYRSPRLGMLNSH